MNSKKMAVICNGKKISYGMNLLHLLQYKNDNVFFTSEMGAAIAAEIYSEDAFRHASISKKTIKVFVEDTKSVDATFTNVFNQYGMNIYAAGEEYIIKVNGKNLSGVEYENFLVYANKRRTGYFSQEAQYGKQVEGLDNKWIAGEFTKNESGGLFGIKKAAKSIMQQQYDCIAFVVYLDFLNK